MAIKSGVGLSTNSDLLVAIDEAAREARATCASPQLVLFWCTFNYPLEHLPTVSKKLSTLFPNAKIAGGTVNGLTFEDKRYDAIYANSTAAAVVTFGGDSLSIGVALEPDPQSDGVGIGQRLGRAICEQVGDVPDGALIFTPGFSNLMTHCDQDILDGIRSIAPRLRITGTGLSGGLRPDGTSEPGFAVLGDRIEKLGTLLVAFKGNLRCGFSVANGLEPLGPGAFVTAANGKWIQTLNGRPAKDVALELLSQGDEEAKEHLTKSLVVSSIERGIALALPDIEGDFFWSRGLAFFTPEGAIFDAFGAKKGMAFSLVKLNSTNCMAAVKQSADMLSDDAGVNEFDFVLAISCALRGFTLGPEIAHEDTELRNHVKAKKQLGIIANGEVGSYRHGRPVATSWVYALFGLASGAR
jgi:hypothetical protein